MNESEWQIRKQRIDMCLRAVQPPWNIIRHRSGLDLASLACHAVEELPTENGPADYGLVVNGRLLAINEAKKVAVNPQNVLEQAKRYSRGATQGPGNWNGCRVRFLHSSSREINWHLDVRHDKAASRQIRGFHTGPVLEALADVISMARPATKEGALLMTAEERVNRAMDHLIAAYRPMREQIRWLSLVRELLVKNLLMEEEDCRCWRCAVERRRRGRCSPICHKRLWNSTK